METRKTSKYLKYAIGEIILVVIGILIALQINTWNDYRKERNEEQFILKKLKSNFEQDVTLYDDCNQLNNYFIQQIDTLLTVLQKPNVNDRDDFGKRIKYVQNFARFSPVKVTYDNIVASGKIGILQNQELVDKLFLYYRNIENNTNGQGSALSEYTRNIITPYFLDFDIWGDFKSPVVENSLLSKRKYQFPIQKKSLEDYATNPFILNALRLKITMLENLKAQYNDRRKDSENLIEIINKELSDD